MKSAESTPFGIVKTFQLNLFFILTDNDKLQGLYTVQVYIVLIKPPQNEKLKIVN